MSFSIEETKTFCNIFDSLKDLVSTIGLQLTSESIIIQSMDESHVVLIQIVFDKTFFRTLHIKIPVQIGLPVDSFLKILKVLNSNDTWVVEIEKDKIVIKDSNKIYSLNLMDLEPLDLEVPDFCYPLDITLPSSSFKKNIDNLSIHKAEEIKFIFTNKGGLVLNSKNDMGECCISLGGELSNYNSLAEQMEKLNLDSSEEFVAVYNSSYLKKISKNISEEINICVSKSLPLKLMCILNNVSYSLFLAQKVQED